VRFTAEDAAALGFATTVLWDLTRPVDRASDAAVARALADAGARVVDSGELR
jgi:nicotinamidase/pyrazinamidase